MGSWPRKGHTGPSPPPAKEAIFRASGPATEGADPPAARCTREMTPSQTNPPPRSATRLRVAFRWLPALLAAGAIVSCEAGPAGEGGTISPESFVEAVVALRTSDLLDASGYMPDGEPERILAEQGIVPDDLRRFAEAHGADVVFMSSLWDEIERRVNEMRNLNRS